MTTHSGAIMQRAWSRCWGLRARMPVRAYGKIEMRLQIELNLMVDWFEYLRIGLSQTFLLSAGWLYVAGETSATRNSGRVSWIAVWIRMTLHSFHLNSDWEAVYQMLTRKFRKSQNRKWQECSECVCSCYWESIWLNFKLFINEIRLSDG